jgi:hypothetical protein
MSGKHSSTTSLPQPEDQQRVSAPANEAITTAIRTKDRLQLEARMQVQEQHALSADIARLERENGEWRRRVAEKFDRRRLVLGGRLSKQMNCTPDAEVTLHSAV